MSLGDTYLQLGQLEKAEKYLKKVLASKETIHNLALIINLYFVGKKRTDYVRALAYKEKSDSLLRISREIDLQNRILTLQRKYEADKLMMEIGCLRKKKQIQQYVWICMCLLLIGLGIVLYWGIKKQYRKIYKKRLKVRMERELKVYRENELAIGNIFIK